MTTSQQYKARIYLDLASWAWLPPARAATITKVLQAFPHWRPDPASPFDTYSPSIRALLRRACSDAEGPLVAASLHWRKTSPTLPAPLADMLHSPAHIKDALVALLPPPPVRLRSRGPAPMSMLSPQWQARLNAAKRRIVHAEGRVNDAKAAYDRAMEEASPHRFELRDALDEARNALRIADATLTTTTFDAKRSLQALSPPPVPQHTHRHAAAALLYAIVAYDVLPEAYREILDAILESGDTKSPVRSQSVTGIS